MYKFSLLKANLNLKGEYYLVKPQLAGVSYFFNREKIKGRLDLFISLFDKDTPELLEMIREFDPKIHFLAKEEQGQLDSPKGLPETQECLRAVCVQKYAPASFWNYITCRAKNINSTWWEDCAPGLDASAIRSCAKGSEGMALLKENIGMNKELQVLLGPAYLLDNQEIFGSNGVPKKEELKSIIKR